jgi:hypothetical protein
MFDSLAVAPMVPLNLFRLMCIRSLCGLAVVLIAQSTCAYEAEGHQTVGAIADIKLKNSAVYQTATNLLHGLTLERAATLPDQIKGWDTQHPVSATAITQSTWADVPQQIKNELFDFWKANPNSSKDLDPPSHRIFHYTDVSVDGPLAYADAKAGINKFDIARMIPYCFNVLNGTTPANNDRRITKSVALILIVHYVGDLHQPLHVGAAFFNSKAQRRAPKNDSDSNAKSDSGGNSVYFPLPTVVKKDSPNLHHFWDDTAVQTAYTQILPPGVSAKDEPSRAAEELAKLVGSSWTPGPSNIEKWTLNRVDGILPEAKQAHDKLRFKKISVVTPKKNGGTTLKPGIGAETVSTLANYVTWSGTITKQELLFAGLDLTELIKRALKP